MNRNSLSRRIRRAVTAAAALFLLLCACAAAGGETVTARPSVNGALHVEAGRLTDESGETVQLRGVSTHGLTWYPQFVSENLFREGLCLPSGPRVSEEDVRYICEMIHASIEA